MTPEKELIELYQQMTKKNEAYIEELRKDIEFWKKEAERR